MTPHSPFMLLFVSMMAMICGVIASIGVRTGSTIAWCVATAFAVLGLATPILAGWFAHLQDARVTYFKEELFKERRAAACAISSETEHEAPPAGSCQATRKSEQRYGRSDRERRVAALHEGLKNLKSQKHTWDNAQVLR